MRKNRILSFFMIFILLFFNIFSTLKVQAATHESGDNVVYKSSCVVPNYNWTYAPAAGAYSYFVDDAAGIPTGGGYYFFKYGNNDKFGAFAKDKIFTFILNSGLGLTVSDERLSTLIQAYFSSTVNAESGTLYTGNGNVLGVCLNDISGCTYEAYPSNTDVTVPSAEVNNVYNWYQYYITVTDPETPDYINVQTYDLDTAGTLINVSNTRNLSYQKIIDDVGNGLCLSYYHGGSGSNEFLYDSGGAYYGIREIDISNCSIYSNSSNGFANFCTAYGLVNNGDTVGYTDIITQAGNAALTVFFYNNSTGAVQTSCTQYSAQVNNATYVQNTKTFQTYNIVRACFVPCMKEHEKLTVYKDSAMFTSIVNHTYAPTTYRSTTYNNYDNTSDNSISTNSSVVNNSTTTNQNIYNDASESFNNYYSSQDNYNIDNSVVIENTTTIINNYYGDDSGGGGGGGGDDDDDDLSDTVWKALLKAIADFFKRLGQLIAVLLTGIVDILTSILTAIASITTSFTGITDLFSSIFGWLPQEIVSLLVLGLGLSLVAAFLTWFKK